MGLEGSPITLPTHHPIAALSNALDHKCTSDQKPEPPLHRWQRMCVYMTTHLEQQPALSPGSLTSILPSGAREPKAPEPDGYDDISLL